ncbi:MAG: DUF896 domain-containing protein [Desulfotomaculaceae bacterium]
MITKELVDRINELARKQRDGGLTREEKTDQKKLREVYLANIRSQVVDAIESSDLRPQKKHDGACGCEHCAPSGDSFKSTEH